MRGVSNLRLRHGFTHFHGLGGVQSMLRLHHAGDAARGLDSTFCAYFEPVNPGVERVHGLGLSGLSSIAGARRRFRERAGPGPDVMAYHNLWGLAFFADLDRAGRRLGVLHSDFPGLARWLPGLRGLLDGVLCVSRPLLELVQRSLPELAGERTAWLPYPVARDRTEAPQPPPGGRPLVLGFAGRLSFAQKRVDRFPRLLRELTAAGVNFRFEVLGEGPQAGWLQRQLAGEPRVRFHGRLSGEAYWRVLRGWDVMVFASDYEGLPIALLEALAVGVVPVFPAIGSGGDDYARGVRPDLLYPAGDTAAAAAVIRRLATAPAGEWAGLRRRANELAAPHLGEGYLETFARQVRTLAALPGIARATFPPVRGQFHLRVPFGLLRRVWPGGLWRCIWGTGA
jgi:glycosyltransferase involved in cell wall biosynthesis